MAESTDDKAVDACIADLRSVLTRLEQAQKKDVAGEDGEETPQGEQPKTFKAARVAVKAHFRRSRRIDENPHLNDDSNRGEKSGNSEDQ